VLTDYERAPLAKAKATWTQPTSCNKHKVDAAWLCLLWLSALLL